jgi:YbgC/YbaW family acyl-CoA thioester hydrolase
MNRHATPDQFPFSIKKTIEFNETDMAGIVHFANFFIFFEIAEAAFFRTLGLTLFDAASNLRWPRVHARCDYTAPLFFDDVATIGVRIGEIKERTITFGFGVFNGSGVTAALGSTVVVCARYDDEEKRIRAQPIPPDILDLLRREM